ncbi:dTMP kinase [Candidatus Micrarchaeota archaeon]|nr:dTMP kinase [Candidatus Micrarchaeota archaeon]
MYLGKGGFILVVLEGIDGTGKNTQIELLKKKLDCVIFKYPTSKYEMLNDYLEKKSSPDPKALFLLFLADIADGQENVKKALEEEKTVILDRYVFSTISYEVNGIDFENGKKIVGSVGYLKPDMVLLLDIDAETSQERKSRQKELDRYEENSAYLENVRANFLRLHEERFLTPNWHRIDATKSIDAVHEEIMRLLS